MGRPRGVKMRAAEGLERSWVELSLRGEVEMKLRWDVEWKMEMEGNSARIP